MPKFHQELKNLSSQLSAVELELQEIDILHITKIFTHTPTHTHTLISILFILIYFHKSISFFLLILFTFSEGTTPK